MRVFSIVFVVVALVGCGLAKRTALASELESLKTRRLAEEVALEGAFRNYAAVRDQRAALLRDRDAARGRAIEVARENPGKVSCIASGAVALSESNLLAQDLKDLGALVGVACLGRYIFDVAFRQEVDQFVRLIDEQSTLVAELGARADALRADIERTTSEWQLRRQSVDALTVSIRQTEEQLRALGY